MESKVERGGYGWPGGKGCGGGGRNYFRVKEVRVREAGDDQPIRECHAQLRAAKRRLTAIGASTIEHTRTFEYQ
jgi:hypothetical protein